MSTSSARHRAGCFAFERVARLVPDKQKKIAFSLKVSKGHRQKLALQWKAGSAGTSGSLVALTGGGRARQTVTEAAFLPLSLRKPNILWVHRIILNEVGDSKRREGLQACALGERQCFSTGLFCSMAPGISSLASLSH